MLRRSIVELCVADHGNDATILTQWLSNKTPEIVASWIASPDNSLLVAVERGTILAVGAVTNAGEVSANYVSPDARFRGVSRALLGTLEAKAIERSRRAVAHPGACCELAGRNRRTICRAPPDLG